MRYRCSPRKHSLEATLVLLLLLCGGVPVGTAPVHAANASITGVYTARQGASTTLGVRMEEDQYVVLLSGGSSDAAGAGAAADCFIRARGVLQGNTLVAHFAPITTETFVYSKAQAEKAQRRLTVVFGPNTAEVVQADTFGYCGVGSSFVGRYRRNTPP